MKFYLSAVLCSSYFLSWAALQSAENLNKEQVDDFFAFNDESYSIEAVFLSIPYELIPLKTDEKLTLIKKQALLIQGATSLQYLDFKNNTKYRIYMLRKGSDTVLLLISPIDMKKAKVQRRRVNLKRDERKWKWREDNIGVQK